MDWLSYTWLIVIVLALGLRMALRFFYGARGPDVGDSVYNVISILSWVLLLLGMFPVLFVGGVPAFGMIICLLTGITFVEYITERRAAERRSLSKLLSLAIARGGQLDSTLLLAGGSFRGLVGRAARNLLGAINDGVPFAAAIVRFPRGLPREAVAYVGGCETAAAKAAALDELSRADRGPLSVAWQTCLDRLMYLVCVLFVMASVTTFTMIWIVPQYQNIFLDFGLELPKATLLVVGLSQFVARYLAVPLALLTILFLLGGLGVAVCYLCDAPVLRPIGDRLLSQRRTSEVLRILAIAAEQRQSIATALGRLAYAFPSSYIRARLTPVAASVEAGADWRAAMLDASIVNSSEHALLSTAEKVGNLPWALRAIAERRARRATYRLAAAVQVLYPCLVLLLGLLIGTFAVGMFTPIVSLIYQLA